MTFAEKVEFLGRRHGCSVTSWGRTEKRNKAARGADNSRHKDWLGADLVPDDWSKAQAIMDDAVGLGLYALNEGDHIHVQEPRR